MSIQITPWELEQLIEGDFSETDFTGRWGRPMKPPRSYSPHAPLNQSERLSKGLQERQQAGFPLPQALTMQNPQQARKPRLAQPFQESSPITGIADLCWRFRKASVAEPSRSPNSFSSDSSSAQEGGCQVGRVLRNHLRLMGEGGVTITGEPRKGRTGRASLAGVARRPSTHLRPQAAGTSDWEREFLPTGRVYTTSI